MHAAYSAQIRSSCLSRQVGSAILDDDGNIISTGTNDVPQAGGGIYGTGFSTIIGNDKRCFACNNPQCQSNVKQNGIIDKLLKEFPEIKIESKEEKEKIIQKLRKKVGLGALLEFSRAIHAEMDSITSAARRGVSIKNTKMFVTTYPCHYCARHIVASGIMEVQFIEPYLKSLALSLHDDAITIDPKSAKDDKKVLFKPFVGVAPKLYEKAFFKDRKLKDDDTGEMKIGEPKWGTKWSLYNSSYTMLELELTKEIENEQD